MTASALASTTTARDAVAGSTGSDLERSIRPDWHSRRVGTAGRLALLHGLVLGAILAAVVISVVRTFSSQSDSSATRLLAVEAVDYQRSADARPAGVGVEAFTRAYLRTRALADGEFVVIAFPNRTTLASAGAGGFAAAAPVQDLLVDSSGASSVATVMAAGAPYRVLTVPIRLGSSKATLVVGSNQSQVQHNERQVLRLVLVEALIALLAGTLAGYLLLRSLLRRIGGITETAAGLGQGELGQRLGDQGTDDEVGLLASTFDAMADRVETAMSSQRQLLADVSHQLRTPLTVVRGHLEVLDRTGPATSTEVAETIDVVVDEIDHMTSLVERLLLLGRAMEPDFAPGHPVDLRSFLADIYTASQVLAVRTWLLAPVPDLTASISFDKVRGALLNLIDNAIKATETTDSIELSAVVRADGWLALAVSDSGPGIPVNQRQQALDRFARLGPPDTRGSGLGLAIVKAVAEAHGGHVEITQSELGGAHVAIILPPAVLVTTVRA